MLKVRAQGYSIEAANPRHEHEWKIWKEIRLPDEKILIPGVVSHCVIRWSTQSSSPTRNMRRLRYQIR